MGTEDSVFADVAAAVAASQDAAPEAAAAPETPAAPADAPKAEAKPAPEGRDEKGRFAAKAAKQAVELVTKDAPAEAATTEPAQGGEVVDTPAPETEAKEAPAPMKAPQSWKLGVREKFAGLPPEVQQEVLRVDGEVRKSMEESAVAKRIASDFQQALAPHMQQFQARGVNPVQHVSELLNASAILANGAPQQKAAFIAQVIRNSGVDINALAQALDAPAQQAQPQQLDQEAVLRRLEQRAQERMEEQQTRRQVQEFWGKAEFANDVHTEMVEVINAGRARGNVPTLEQAYERACRINPEVAAVLQQREAAKAAAGTQASSQRARAASSSVKSQPSGVVAPKKLDTTLDYVLAAAAAQGRR